MLTAALAVPALIGSFAVGFMAPAHAASPTVVSLTFDDGNDNQLAAAQVMNSKGMLGTFYITTDWIGQPGWLTQANLSTIAAAGNEIGAHTKTHPDLTTVTSAVATDEMCGGRTVLQGWGYSAASFAYPFAAQNASVQQIAASCGFTSARGLGDVKSPTSCAACEVGESIPPANAMDTAAPDEVDSSWTLQTFQNEVTQAAGTGRWVQLTFHHIALSTDPTLTVSPTVFDEFTTWLQGQVSTGAVQVKTVGDVIGGTSTPNPSPSPSPSQSPTTFADVPATNQFYTEIQWAYNQKIAFGYTDGTYHPTEAISREAMAAFIYRFKGSPPVAAPTVSPFADVPLTDPFIKEITWLKSTGISTGFDNGVNFHPYDPINRDAMAAFLYRMHGQTYTPTSSPFTDVTPTTQFYTEINWLAANNITTGMTPTTFGPRQSVNRDAMAAFLMRYDSLFQRN